MNTNSSLLLGEKVYRIVGCAMELLSRLGQGLPEKPYENEPGLLLNNLRIARHTVGVILNFKRSRLESEKIVLTRHE